MANPLTLKDLKPLENLLRPYTKLSIITTKKESTQSLECHQSDSN